MAARKKLGDLLIEAGAIDELQLKAALAHQRQWGGRIGRTLVEMRFVGEDQICDTVARQLGVPSVRLAGRSVDPALLDLVPRELCEKHWIFPLALVPGDRGEKLQVAMSDPTNLVIIDELAFRTGKRIEVAVAPDSHIDMAIRQHFYGEYIVRSKADEAATPPEVQFGGRKLETAGADFVDEVPLDGLEFAPAPGGSPVAPQEGAAFASAGTAAGAPAGRAVAGGPPVLALAAGAFDPLAAPPRLAPTAGPATPPGRPGPASAVPPAAGPGAWEYRPPGPPPILAPASGGRAPPPAAAARGRTAPPPAPAAGAGPDDDLLSQLFGGASGSATPDLVDALLGLGPSPESEPRLPGDDDEMAAIRRELFAAPGEQGGLTDESASGAPPWAPPLPAPPSAEPSWPSPSGPAPDSLPGEAAVWGDVELLEEVDTGGDAAPLVMGTLLEPGEEAGSAAGAAPSDEAELLAALETMAAGREALPPGKLLASLALALIRSGAIRAADLLERWR